MPRIRTLKPEILEDQKTAALDDTSWRVFVSLIILADDYGNGRADPRWLSGQILWMQGDRSKTMRETLATLSRDSREGARDSLITLYEVHGQPYFSIRQFKRHQKVDHPGKPRVPGPEIVDSEKPQQAISTSYTKSSRDSRESVATESRVTSETLAPDPDPDPERDPDPDHRGLGVVGSASPMSVDELQAHGNAKWGWVAMERTAHATARLLEPFDVSGVELAKQTRDESRKAKGEDPQHRPEDWAYFLGIYKRQREEAQRTPMSNTQRPPRPSRGDSNGNGTHKPPAHDVWKDTPLPPDVPLPPEEIEATKAILRKLGASGEELARRAAQAEH